MYDVCMYVQILAVCWTNVAWRLLALFVITTPCVISVCIQSICIFYLYFLDADKLVGLESEAQNLVNCLQILEVLTPAVHVELLSKVTVCNSLVWLAIKADKVMLTTIQV